MCPSLIIFRIITSVNKNKGQAHNLSFIYNLLVYAVIAYNIQVLVTFRVTAVPANHTAAFVLYRVAALRAVLHFAVGTLESTVG